MDERAVGRAMRRFWSLGSDVLARNGATAVRNEVAPGHLVERRHDVEHRHPLDPRPG